MNIETPKIKSKAPEEVISSLSSLLNKNEYLKTLEYGIILCEKFPIDEQIHYIMGLAYYFSKDFTKSLYHFKFAVKLKPNFYEALNNLGILYSEYNTQKNKTNSNEIKKSIFYLKTAIKINSNNACAYENLGNIYFKIGDYFKSIKAFDKAREIKPLTNEDAEKLIISRKNEGLINEALEFIEELQNKKIIPNLIFQETSLTHTILPNKDEIFKQRNRIINSINKYQTKKISDFNVDISLNPKFYLFHLSYDGLPTKEIFKKQGILFQKYIPKINLFKEKKSDNLRKIKVGVFTKFITNHPVSYCFLDIFLGLNSKEFEVIIFTSDAKGKNKKINKNLCSNVKFKFFENSDLKIIRDTICKEYLDILIYPEIGLTGTSYYLAAHKLAKKQIALGGHPDTTGLNTVDYFIGNKLNQPSNAQNYYTEKLVLFNNTVLSGSLENESKLIPRNLSLSDFNLPNEKNYYGCLQSLFKIHPDFDNILNEITYLDPNSLIVFTVFPNKSAVINLLKRWKKSFPNLLNHIIFLKRLPHLKFLRLSELIDVHLDTIHFGMGSTGHQILNLKKPIVTWQGEFARGRYISSIYKKYKFKKCPLAKHQKNYAKIAVDWATNKKLSKQFELEISEKSEKLFSDTQNIIFEFENFFKKINK